ncbi:MAG: hypothetical protein KAX49_18645, partial [Halanaerobiales bacterium]|nr:hypothetical protein [Halanaerobiales bacterium]
MKISLKDIMVTDKLNKEPTHKELKILNQEPIRIINNVDTKCRRLKYLTLILLTIEDKYLPEIILSKRVEEVANEKNKFIENHIDNKGIIVKSARLKSGKPYLNLSEKFFIVLKMLGKYRCGKLGKVLYFLLKENEEIEVTNFSLNTIEKLYYLFVLLKYDFTINIILTKMSLAGYTCYKQFSGNFNEFFEGYLYDLKSYITEKKAEEIIFMTKRKFQKLSPKSFEHVLYPRQNWLLDLEIFSHREYMNSKEYVLCESFKDIVDKGLFDCYSIEYLENNYIKIFHLIYCYYSPTN